MTKTKSVRGELKGTPVYDIAKVIKHTDEKGKVYKNSPSIVRGITPKKPSFKEGYQILGPEQLATLLVPKQHISVGKIQGFQRDAKVAHIRKIFSALNEGKIMPTVEVGLYNNAAWVVDGQQRILAAIMAGESLPVNMRKLDATQMNQLFSDQPKGIRVNPSTIILSAYDPFSEYVQEAVTDPKHIWSELVTHRTSSQTKLTPKQMFDAVSSYTTNTLGRHKKHVSEEEFDKQFADELAEMFLAFGNKKTNPLAFTPVAVKAITYAATIIIRRNGSKAADIKRWKDWMPLFQFNQYAQVRRSKELAWVLVQHWNKRLGENRKIKIPDELL